MNVTHEKLNTIAGNDSKDLRDSVDGESIEEDAVDKLDVCVLAELALQFLQAVVVEAFDKNDA